MGIHRGQIAFGQYVFDFGGRGIPADFTQGRTEYQERRNCVFLIAV